MTSNIQDPLEKTESTDIASIDKRAGADLAFLARAASADRALHPLQAVYIHWRAFCWCIFVCVGALLWGYDTQVSSGMLSVPQFRKDFGILYEGQFVLPAKWQTAFNCVNSIGGMFGGLSLGWISERLGRRGAVAVACSASVIGVLLQFLSPNHMDAMLLVGKLINGFAIGLHVSCASNYCAEVSPLALRDITTSSVNFWINLGSLIASSIGRGTGNWKTVYAYRLPFALQWVFPMILLIGLPFAPESPWWLVHKGRDEDAEKVIVRLGGSTVDPKFVRQQIYETIKLENSYAETSAYLDCFKGENFKRTVIAMMVFVLKHCAGVTFIDGYSTYFFELAGFATNDAFNLTVGAVAIGLVGNLLFCYITCRFGRRVIVNLGMVVCTAILLLIGFVWIRNADSSAKWTVTALTMIYHFSYQTSIGPVAYVIFAEVSSAKLRSKTVGLGTLVNALGNMLSNIIVPYLINPDEANLGGYTSFVFGGLAFAGTVWAYFFMPETKGRTVDELDLLFEKRLPARRFGSYMLGEHEAVSFDI